MITYSATWARTLLICFALSAVTFPSVASAWVFLVNSLQDTVDAVPGDGACADAASNCTLRAAIQEANAAAGPDTIQLPAGTYILSIPGNAEHAAATGDLDITDGLIIKGAGATATIIDGGGIDRIFETIHAGAVQIEDLTLQNGVAGANTPGYFVNYVGGAISNVGNTSNLTLLNVVLRNNSAQSGGGIFNIFSTLYVHNSTLHDNIATAGNGGGIAEGLAAFSRLYNVTLSNNQATVSGGGLSSSNNTPLLNNVTITGNIADSDNNGTGDGGGISRGITAATITNSIVAGNNDLGGEAPDCADSLNSSGYNLVGNNSGCVITPNTGDQIGSGVSPLNPGLSVLSDNGGTTPTHALLNGSPALDTGNPATPGSGGGACEATDQRGTDRTANTTCDIGAFEAASSMGLIFDVNSTADLTDGAIGDGRCETVPGNNECTLRAAIQETNARVGADTINLPGGTFLLTRAGANEDAALSGDLDISDLVTIRGSGAATTVIDANSLDRSFEVRMQGGLDIAGVTIRNGLVTGSGGGIKHQANGDLTISDSIITNNIATGANASGGGVFSVAFTLLTINNSTITKNSATLYGGGVANFTLSTAIINNATISGNTSGSIGGGLMNSFASSTTVYGSTISDNQAPQGGGIGTNWGQGFVTLINTTVSGNRGTLNGGGIHVSGGDTVALRNSTLTQNQALGTAIGGGISNYGTVITRNSIVAGNQDASNSTPDCSGNLTSQGYNLIGDTTGCAVAASAGDQLGTGMAPIDPRLGPLSDNNGPTHTHAPIVDSPAVDSGNPATPGIGGLSCEGTDQRGHDRGLSASCDIGAVELAVADLAITLTSSSVMATPNQTITYSITVDNAGPDSADQLLMTFLLPQGSRLDGISGANWSCNESGGIASCSRLALASGNQSILTASVTLGPDAGTWSTTGDIIASGLDPNSTNNSVTLEQTISAVPQPSSGAGLFYRAQRAIVAAESDSISNSADEEDNEASESALQSQSESKPYATPSSPVNSYDYSVSQTDSTAAARTAGNASTGGGTTWSTGNKAGATTDFAKLARAAMARDKQEPAASALNNPALWQELEAMKRAMHDSTKASRNKDTLLVDTVKTAGIFLAAGATNWYIKSSALLASILSTLPLWAPFDPLPVLALSRRERKKRKAKAAAEREAENRASKKLGDLLDPKPSGQHA